MRPKGIDPKMSQGRYVPQRDCVRSAMDPINGSVTTSNIRAISISAAASANVRPNTLVKKSGKAMDIIFQMIPPEAASPRAYPIFSRNGTIVIYDWTIYNWTIYNWTIYNWTIYNWTIYDWTNYLKVILVILKPLPTTDIAPPQLSTKFLQASVYSKP